MDILPAATDYLTTMFARFQMYFWLMLAKREADSSWQAATAALHIYDAVVKSDPTNQGYRDLQRKAQVAVGRARTTRAAVNIELDRI